MTIIFRQGTHPDWLIFDDGSSKIEFKRGTMYVKDLAEYLLTKEIEPYDTRSQAEIDLEVKKAALLQQEKTLLNLIIDNQYHLNTKRKKFIPDIPTWEILLDKWDDQLDLVRAQIELMNEGKDFVLIDVDPVPVF